MTPHFGIKKIRSEGPSYFPQYTRNNSRIIPKELLDRPGKTSRTINILFWNYLWDGGGMALDDGRMLVELPWYCSCCWLSLMLLLHCCGAVPAAAATMLSPRCHHIVTMLSPLSKHQATNAVLPTMICFFSSATAFDAVPTASYKIQPA